LFASFPKILAFFFLNYLFLFFSSAKVAVRNDSSGFPVWTDMKAEPGPAILTKSKDDFHYMIFWYRDKQTGWNNIKLLNLAEGSVNNFQKYIFPI